MTHTKAPSPGTGSIHPQLDDDGRVVKILRPSKPTAQDVWNDPESFAAVIPGGEMPQALNGVPFEAWENPPRTAQGWENLAQTAWVDEPAFDPPPGLVAAAGVVIQEADGRIWLVCPTNQFGGYEMTFPKGRPEGKSLQAAALAEAYEESGLQVRLLRHLIDVKRSTTYTRYYLAERIGGSPAAMGWESQCVMLVPLAQTSEWRLAASDQTIVQAISSTSA